MGLRLSDIGEPLAWASTGMVFKHKHEDKIIKIMPRVPSKEPVRYIKRKLDDVDWMMHEANKNGRQLNSFVVRKEGKAHGLQRRIEGPDVKGKRVLAVEDTSTTGGSVLTAVEALKEAGAIVVGVAVVVDRGAGPKIEEAGLKYVSVISLQELGLA